MECVYNHGTPGGALMDERVKNILRVVVGAAIVVGSVWGVTDFTLDQSTAEVVRAVAVLLLVLYHRFRPAP